MIKKIYYRALRLVNYLPDKAAVKLNYFLAMRKRLNLNNPQTLNEKIQWLQLYHYGDAETKCSDKLLVRDYLISKGLEEHLPKLYGSWDSAEEIPFEDLPNQFVLKTNHGCGFNIICKDKSKLDVKSTVKKLSKWMRIDYSRETGELHYRKIKRKIICEEYLSEIAGEDVIDYKYHCFNGKPNCILVCTNRFEVGGLKLQYFDLDWNRLDYAAGKEASKDRVPRPEGLEEMNRICRILAEDFIFVRVDLYCIGTKVFLGELTFTPAGGHIKYLTDYAQENFGELLDISERI